MWTVGGRTLVSGHLLRKLDNGRADVWEQKELAKMSSMHFISPSVVKGRRSKGEAGKQGQNGALLAWWQSQRRGGWCGQGAVESGKEVGYAGPATNGDRRCPRLLIRGRRHTAGVGLGPLLK